MSKNKNICFIDTEFNALDYSNMNDGYQEIVQIGAVAFNNGKVTGRFSRYCLLKPGHKLSRRCKKLTGIQTETISENGVPFLQAVNDFRDFIEKHNISRVYAFGPADQFELRSSAKLNNADKDIFDMINQIKNVYPAFQSGLALHYTFSLSDICKICNVEHDIDGRAHNALFDAEDTGLAFFNMCKGLIDYNILDSIDQHKYNVKIYRNSRNIKNASIKPIPEINEDFISNINKVFDNAANVVGEPIIRALRDDMMRLIGRPDLEIGEEGL